MLIEEPINGVMKEFRVAIINADFFSAEVSMIPPSILNEG
jgi:hypothetical protein